MNKKIGSMIVAVLLTVLSIIWVSAGSANATPTQFKSYSTTVTWYKAGGTLDNIWPQNLTEISCGGIKQVDSYDITSKQMDEHYKALINGGVLNGPADDNEFNPHNYSVTLLPPCQVTIAVVAAPVPTSPSCDHAGTATVPADTADVHWTLNGDVATATAQGNDVFSDGKTAETFTELVLPQITGTACTERIPVPAAPDTTPGTCSLGGSIVIPANTSMVKYLVDGQQVNGGLGGSVTSSGSHAISAHTTIDYLFVGDMREVDWTITTPAQLSGEACATDTPSPTPTDTPSPTPTKSTSSAPAPTPSSSSTTSKAIAPAVSTVKASPVAQKTALASTGTQTENLLALGFGLLLVGSLLTFGLIGRKPKGRRV